MCLPGFDRTWEAAAASVYQCAWACKISGLNSASLLRAFATKPLPVPRFELACESPAPSPESTDTSSPSLRSALVSPAMKDEIPPGTGAEYGVRRATRFNRNHRDTRASDREVQRPCSSLHERSRRKATGTSARTRSIHRLPPNSLRGKLDGMRK